MRRRLDALCHLGSPLEDRFVAAVGNLEDQRLCRSFRGKIRLDPLPEFRGIDPDDVVLASVIGQGPAKDLCADLLLVDLGAPVLERLHSDVEQKVAQPS